MRKTFVCDESMVITIPIGRLKDVREGQLMPNEFHCVFRDSYKIFVLRGQPKPLGAAQAIAGLFLFILGLVFTDEVTKMYTLPSVLFVISGMLSYAAGNYANMHMTKLSFSLTIISFFWSLVAFSLGGFFGFIDSSKSPDNVIKAINGLIMSLLMVENVIALFLIYWLSKAVCREHFNTLPIILLKQGD